MGFQLLGFTSYIHVYLLFTTKSSLEWSHLSNLVQISFIKFSPNIKDDKQQQYKTILIIMESKASLGVYLGLGVSVDVQDKKIQHFTPLLDTISSKIAQ